MKESLANIECRCDPLQKEPGLFTDDLIAAVNRSSLVRVRAGDDRPEPLEIWVVSVGNRLFARSWGLSERSWYTTFLTGTAGSLECGGLRVRVVGRRPPDLEVITPLIDAEYLRKYDRGENSGYAHGILRPDHVERTLEFMPVADRR